MIQELQEQLSALMETLSRTEPNFVRCLKSNADKEPHIFDSPLILTQMRYSGNILSQIISYFIW